LGLWSVEERRNRADIEVYTIFKGLSDVPFNSMFTFMEENISKGSHLILRKN